jgi:hypothetical protein
VSDKGAVALACNAVSWRTQAYHMQVLELSTHLRNGLLKHTICSHYVAVSSAV